MKLLSECKARRETTASTTSPLPPHCSSRNKRIRGNGGVSTHVKIRQGRCTYVMGISHASVKHTNIEKGHPITTATITTTFPLAWQVYGALIPGCADTKKTLNTEKRMGMDRQAQTQ